VCSPLGSYASGWRYEALRVRARSPDGPAVAPLVEMSALTPFFARHSPPSLRTAEGARAGGQASRQEVGRA